MTDIFRRPLRQDHEVMEMLAKPGPLHFYHERFRDLHQRRHSFGLFFQLLLKHWPNDQGVLVETGMIRGTAPMNWRGEGCSTILFRDFVQANKGMVWSVDNDPEVVTRARGLLKGGYQVDLVESDSVEFLEEFSHEIDGLYLDSGDVA